MSKAEDNRRVVGGIGQEKHNGESIEEGMNRRNDQDGQDGQNGRNRHNRQNNQGWKDVKSWLNGQLVHGGPNGREWPSWGDLGCGYYRNPVLNGDFSDPDVIRVGDDFYMVCSDFHYMGMQVLHSSDLVNWSIIGRVYDRLDIDPAYGAMNAYGKGSWAPALRYHNGLFYVYFCTPDEGLYMSTASDPAGPWSPLHEVRRVSGWEDPCPFWDDDGQAYLGHSTVGAGPIVLHRMSEDGRRLLDDGIIVYVGKIAEGTKIYKRNGYYYLVIPEGGVETGWQTVLRSATLYGPYERRVTLRQGATKVNGPHQGSLVELESGETWFMHFQSAGALGRVCHLQPVRWEDGWPVMGADGEPVSVYVKPITGRIGPAGMSAIAGGIRELSDRKAEGEIAPPEGKAAVIEEKASRSVGTTDKAFWPVRLPQTSDAFSGPELGLQWQWNHNPVPEAWSLAARPGWLRLTALPPAEEVPDQLRTEEGRPVPPPLPELLLARNSLTQKLIGSRGAAQVVLDPAGMKPGQRAGLALVGGREVNWIGAVAGTDGVRLAAVTAGTVYHGPPLGKGTVTLGAVIDAEGETAFRFASEGLGAMPFGGVFTLAAGFWKGARLALFCYTNGAEGGWADFCSFRYGVLDGPEVEV